MNQRSTAGRWAAWTGLAALSAGLCVVAAGWAGDKPPPKSDEPPDFLTVIHVRISTPSPGSAEPVGDITIVKATKVETLSPPYSKDLRELTGKLNGYVKDARDAGLSKPTLVIQGDSDLKFKAVVRVMEACRKAGLTAQIEEADAADELDLTNPDLGNDPTQQLNYNVTRIEDVTVPGPVDATTVIGIPNAPDTTRQNVPLPPGIGGGSGGVPSLDLGGLGSPYGPGSVMTAGFSSRTGSMRKQMLQEGGGNAMSEAAVAKGLLWLARHQAPDGHWSLDHFEQFAHEDAFPTNKIEKCTCTGQVSRQDDIAATGFALLPFLGAGCTNKPNKAAGAADYSKTVKAGLDFLIAKQGKDGYFGGSMYSHGIATTALCEAYGMTSDPTLKTPAQKAIHFIETAQDPDGGGWRYAPRTAGDLSVTGWQIQALKSAQLAGLDLANKGEALKKAELFLDSVETSEKGGYSYMPGSPETVVMTAVGMWCRQSMGVHPRNPGLLAGVDRLKTVPPGMANNIYYEYYAAPVMYNMGGDAWDFWNNGPDGKDSHTGFRDRLIAKQCTTTGKGDLPGATPALPAEMAHENGSWDPDGAWGANGGGRIMVTSLSLLTLEVYYRHPPLYRKDAGGEKDK